MSATSVRNASSEGLNGRGKPDRRRPGRPWAHRPATDRRSAPSPQRPERRVATGSSADIGHGRIALHAAVGVLGWAVFIGLWAWQLEVFVPVEWLRGVGALAAVAVGFALLTPAWVWWNRNIYKRRHRRRAPVVREVGMERDALGRELIVAPAVLLNPVEVRITVDRDGAVKRYDVPPLAVPAELEVAVEAAAVPLEEARSA